MTDAVIAGFIDADGSIGETAGNTRIQLAQSHQFGLDVLNLIKDYTGSGHVYGPYRETEFKLHWNGAEADRIVDEIMVHAVIKPELQMWNITDEWVGGFFAGDGHASLRSGISPIVCITQQSHPELLHEICNTLGYGTVQEGQFWSCTGKNAKRFARRFNKFALHKQTDLLALI